MILRTPKSKRYTAVSNKLAQDSSLPFEARGLMLYLLSKPADWSVMVEDLIKASPAGKDKVYRILADLERAGYIRRQQVRSKDGTLAGTVYMVLEEPGIEPVEETVPTRAKPRASRAATAASGFDPSESDLAWAKGHGVTNMAELLRVTGEMRDHFLSAGTRRQDWSATWRNWVRRATDPNHWGYNPALTQADYSNFTL